MHFSEIVSPAFIRFPKVLWSQIIYDHSNRGPWFRALTLTCCGVSVSETSVVRWLLTNIKLGLKDKNIGKLSTESGERSRRELVRLRSAEQWESVVETWRGMIFLHWLKTGNCLLPSSEQLSVHCHRLY